MTTAEVFAVTIIRLVLPLFQVSDTGGPELGWDWWTAIAGLIGPGPLGFIVWATQIKNPPIWVRWGEHEALVKLSEKQAATIEQTNKDNSTAMQKLFDWAMTGMKGPAPM